MAYDNLEAKDRSIPAELRQRLPVKTRFTARVAYYIAGNAAVSVPILVFAVMAFSMAAKNVRNGRELARDGRLAYTGDVRSGGMHLATVYYSFTYNGQLYRGEALLPHRYLSEIDDYAKHGNFPILFFPGDPSINHPYDWQDDESYSFAFGGYVLVAIVIIQWLALGRFIYRDMKLAQPMSDPSS
jgi:hypothetical protein